MSSSPNPQCRSAEGPSWCNRWPESDKSSSGTSSPQTLRGKRTLSFEHQVTDKTTSSTSNFHCAFSKDLKVQGKGHVVGSRDVHWSSRDTPLSSDTRRRGRSCIGREIALKMPGRAKC